MTQKVSIIMPSLNEGENLQKTVQSLRETTDCNYEIIVVDDGSTDGSSDFIEQAAGPDCTRLHLVKTDCRLGVAKARNYGADCAEGDVLVFADAHILFPHSWLVPILDVLDREDVGIVATGVAAWENSTAIGFGMRWRNARLDVQWLDKKGAGPYSVPLIPGMFMTFRRALFREIGGFDTGMVNYGSEDLEICLRTWLLGYKVVIVPQVQISHLFRPRHPYAVNWTDIIHNMLRTVYAHFNSERVDRVVAALKSFPCFEPAFNLVRSGDIRDRRQALAQARKHDDNWFFDKFGFNI